MTPEELKARTKAFELVAIFTASRKSARESNL
jgi:hypothetical protein